MLTSWQRQRFFQYFCKETSPWHDAIKSPNGKNIHVFQLLFKEDGSAELLEWDDYSLDGESIEGETKEGMNYYLLNESTPYGSVFCLWEE